MYFELGYELIRAEALVMEILSITENWRDIRRDTTSDIIKEYQGEVYDHIESGGGGAWPGFHPLSIRFKYNRSRNLWERRGRLLGRANYNWLMQYVGSRVSRDGSFGRVRFGKAKTFGAKKLQERAGWVEGGHKTRVTPRMRRLMGASRGKGRFGRKKAGKGYFPLKSSTSELVIKPRPIMEPVYQQQNRLVPTWAEKSLARNIKKQKGKR